MCQNRKLSSSTGSTKYVFHLEKHYDSQREPSNGKLPVKNSKAMPPPEIPPQKTGFAAVDKHKNDNKFPVGSIFFRPTFHLRTRNSCSTMPTSARNCFIMFSYLDDKWHANDGRVSIWSRFLISSRPRLADLLPIGLEGERKNRQIISRQ